MRKSGATLFVLVLVAMFASGTSEAGTTKTATVGRGFAFATQRRAAPELPVYTWSGKPRVKYVERFRISSEKNFDSGAVIGGRYFYWGKRCPTLTPFAEKLIFMVFERRWKVSGVRFSRLGKDLCLRGLEITPPVSFLLKR